MKIFRIVIEMEVETEEESAAVKTMHDLIDAARANKASIYDYDIVQIVRDSQAYIDH